MRGLNWVLVGCLGFVALTCPPPLLAGALLDTPAFREMQARDFAPEPTLAFAELAEQAGDPDAAIAALEQALLRVPGDDRLRARLADLYQAAGNDEMARHHGAAPERATQVWGRASLGAGHDSNPTGAENGAVSQVFDAVNNAFVQVAARPREPDALATFRLDLNATHRLSEEALLAAELRVTGERYKTQRELDNLSAGLVAGPWLGPGKTALGAIYIRPFATLGAGMLDGQPYYTQAGGGTEMRFELGADLSGSVALGISRTDYNGALLDNFPLNRFDNTAFTASSGLSGTGPLDLSWGAGIQAGVIAAKANPESYVYLGAYAGAAVPLAPVEDLTGLPVTLRLGGSLDHYRYRNIDPVVDPTRQREDFWAGGTGALTIGLIDTLDLTIGADYVRRFSNIAPFDNDNLRVYYELGYRF